VYRQDREQERRLLAALEHLGLNAVYVDSDAARFTFDASERIFFATPFSDRIHDHLDFVDGAEHAAFLFHYPTHTPAFEGTLKLAGARYRKKVVAGFILYSAIGSSSVTELRFAGAVRHWQGNILRSLEAEYPLALEGIAERLGRSFRTLA
jgi:hypothetical protein